MNSRTTVFTPPVPAAGAAGPPGRAGTFDWIFIAASAWLLFGLYLDGWAHHHVPSLETFFTPWHAVLYSGFASVTACLLVAALIERRRTGAPLTATLLPSPYRTSLVGAAVFALGGALDMLWHLTFGVEADIDALLSPTHLLLAFAGLLMVTGPLRAALSRAAARPVSPPPRVGWSESGPAVISLAAVLAVITFFTMYMQPFARDGASRLIDVGGEIARWNTEGLAIASVLAFSALLVGLVLAAIDRGLRMPAGALTAIVGIDGLGMSVTRDQWLSTGPLPMIVAVLAGGIIADLILVALRPSPDRPAAMRSFGALAPPALFVPYFTATAVAGGGLAWSVHLIAGTFVLAGAAGWAVAALVTGPRLMRAGR